MQEKNRSDQVKELHCSGGGFSCIGRFRRRTILIERVELGY